MDTLGSNLLVDRKMKLRQKLEDVLYHEETF